MKKLVIILNVFAVFILAACNPSKKTTASSVPSGKAPVTTQTQANNILFVKPSKGIQMPGDEELAAIRLRYDEMTMEKLKQGHTIYTQGACVNCHGAVNIYNYGEERWKTIVDDMAKRAMISAAEKDAVYKYVLAIKATQPK